MSKINIERLRDFFSLTKELGISLRDLTFGDNFKSFEETVTISATSEYQFRNQLNFIPTRYIIVSQEGNGVVTKGSTQWTSDFVYLYNNGSVDVTITVIFLR